MTGQAYEILILDGEELPMKSCPGIPEDHPSIIPAESLGFTTSCYRDYIGTWEIRDNNFYLKSIKGKALD